MCVAVGGGCGWWKEISLYMCTYIYVKHYVEVNYFVLLFLIQALFLDSDTCKGASLDNFRFMQNGLSLFSVQPDVLEP